MSPREKKLLLGLGVATFLAIGLLVSTIILGIKVADDDEKSDSESPIRQPDEFCLTPECVLAAGDIIRSMDTSVVPCDDFYEFSCGRWVDDNPIPDTASSWGRFNILRNKLNQDVRSILEEPVNASEPQPLKDAKAFYASCASDENINDQSPLQILVDLLLENIDTEALGSKLGELRAKTSSNYIFALSVSLDEENADKYSIYLDQPNLGLNQAFLLDSGEGEHKNKEAYRTFIQNAWMLVYENTEAGDAAVIADNLVAFETRLANISAKPEDRRNRTELYNPMTIRELNDLTATATMIKWEDYIIESFKEVLTAEDAFNPILDLRVIVRDVEYFKSLGEVLSTEIETNAEIIEHYLKWRIIQYYVNEVSQALRDVYFQFLRATQGTQFPSPRWQMCSDTANNFFGMAVSFHYVQQVFTGNFSEQISGLVTNIRESFLEILNEIDWIGDEGTREKAREKANKIKSFIGYPEWLINPENDHAELVAYYENLTLAVPDNHFENIKDLVRWRNLDDLYNIVKTKDVDRWITNPTVVNAFYSSTYNSISFPAGILQPPFYFTGRPIQALNYGAIGMVMGHEITHGFDDRGRQSDGDGNLVDWWDEETLAQYIQKANCFINQYGSYVAEEVGLNLNGNNTLGENIADNGGLRQAYRAYEAYISANGEEPKLPGLEAYTPKQLFFVAFAQIWCGAYTPQGMESQIRTGVHSPTRFRVKGVLENSEEFAQVWGCPPPNPETKCQIW